VDKSASFVGNATPRRSTSSLGDTVTSATTLGPTPIPRGVLIALGFFGASFLVGVVRVILINLARGPDHVIFHVTFGIVFITAVGSVWIYGLYSRRNWVRWFTIVWMGFGALVTPWAPPNISDSRQLELTRFRGHPNVSHGGVRDGVQEYPVHTGV
jgi:hypothetical protein